MKTETAAFAITAALHVPLVFALTTHGSETHVETTPEARVRVDLPPSKRTTPAHQRRVSDSLVVRRDHSTPSASGRSSLASRPTARRLVLPASDPEPGVRMVGVRVPAAEGVSTFELGGVVGAGPASKGPGGADAGVATQARKIFGLREVDVAPRRRSGSAPKYPGLEARAGREGWVTVRIVVDEAGAVEDVTLEECHGASSFGDAALEAVRGWRFDPARRGGGAVPCVCFQRLNFKLDEAR